MLTFPMMVLKLIPQLDMFVLRPKIETTRYNVVQIYAVVAVLPCRFHVYFVFWVLKKVHLKNVFVTYSNREIVILCNISVPTYTVYLLKKQSDQMSFET